MAMLGITNHSKVPLRLATMLGFAVSFLSLFVALGYLVFKLLYWNSFSLGLAPLVDRPFLFRLGAAFLHRHSGRVYRRDPHPGPETAPCGRTGTDQLRTGNRERLLLIMKVVILCGGLGTRLREETEFRPKPMVPIGNRPILWHIMKFYAHLRVQGIHPLPRLQGRGDQGIFPQLPVALQRRDPAARAHAADHLPQPACRGGLAGHAARHRPGHA